MRKLAWFIGGVTLVACGAYVFIYLYRWEWHRALFVAILFVAAEVGMLAALVLRRLASLREEQGRAARAGPDPEVLARLRAAPSSRDHFEWLRRDLSRTNVFLTVLLGGGVVLSAGAWLVDRIAHGTAGRAVDRGLAEDLGDLAFPSDGLVADEAELLAAEAPYHDDPQLRLLLGPTARNR